MLGQAIPSAFGRFRAAETSNELTKASIRKNLVPLLPKYMIPTKIHKLEKLPMNKNGKIDRPQLVRDWFEN